MDPACLKSTLTDHERLSFEDNGFLIVEDVLDSNDLAKLTSVVDRLDQRERAVGNENKLLSITNVIHEDDAFLDLVKAHDAGKDFSGISGVWWKTSDGQIVKNEDLPSTKDLTRYPWPDRSRSRYKDYYLPGTKQPMVTTAITSRGCPHSCPFCLTYKQQYRLRDIDHILDEMEHCLSLGITETHFIDDLFTPNSQWVLKFCK